MILDILAFGIHPDDVELSAGGTLLKHKALGYKVGICDLTHGELGSRGSGELRLVEAANAAKILGIDARENIGLPDAWAIDNQESCLKIIQIIRKYRPRIILCNAKEDRHPDHAKGAEMVQKANVLAKSTIPPAFKRKEVVAAVQQLAKDSKQLDQLVKGKKSDKAISEALTQLHDVFHKIVGLCSAEAQH